MQKTPTLLNSIHGGNDIEAMKNGDSVVTAAPESRNGEGLQGGALVGRTNALPPRLLSYEDASAYISLSYWSVRTLVTTGQVPHIRFGKRTLIDVQDLDKWIEQHKEVGV